MADFSHLKALEVTRDKTSEYTIHSVTVNGKTPTLIGRPATQSNEPYFNALLKTGAKNAKAMQAGKVNVSMIAENRDEDRILFPLHVITGWYDMLDATGTELEFNQEECVELFNNLPIHVLDDVLTHYRTAENFVDAIDITVKAKNSPAA